MSMVCVRCECETCECEGDPMGEELIKAIKSHTEQMRKLTDSIDRLGDLLPGPGMVS